MQLTFWTPLVYRNISRQWIITYDKAHDKNILWKTPSSSLNNTAPSRLWKAVPHRFWLWLKKIDIIALRQAPNTSTQSLPADVDADFFYLFVHCCTLIGHISCPSPSAVLASCSIFNPPLLQAQSSHIFIKLSLTARSISVNCQCKYRKTQKNNWVGCLISVVFSSCSKPPCPMYYLTPSVPRYPNSVDCQIMSCQYQFSPYLVLLREISDVQLRFSAHLHLYKTVWLFRRTLM